MRKLPAGTAVLLLSAATLSCLMAQPGSGQDSVVLVPGVAPLPLARPPHLGASSVQGDPPPPANSPAFWEAEMRDPLAVGSRQVSLSIDQMLNRMIAQSNQLKAFSELPLIANTAVAEAEGQFDPYVFGEGNLTNDDHIRSSILETGTSSSAPPNLVDRLGSVEFGVAQPLPWGGELRLSQRFETETSNSEFFVPDEQSRSELRLELDMPLLDGAGIEVNQAPIVQAELETARSIAEFQRSIETQFSEALRTYWTLYAERSHVLQRQRLVQQLMQVASQIDARQNVDSLPSESRQAAAAIRRAKASILRAQLAVENNESRLAALLSDPSLKGSHVEILPTQRVVHRPVTASIDHIGTIAERNRPEIRAVDLQIANADVALAVARNGLLPDLDLYGAVTVGGFGAGRDFNDALDGQFDGQNNGSEIGIRFKAPIGNVEADAIYQRRILQLRQLYFQRRNVSDTVMLEVEVAAHEVQVSHEEMQAYLAELEALDAEIVALKQRSNEGLETGNAFLATFISSLEQREMAEERLMEATVGYNLALYELERAAGTLITVRGVGAVRVGFDPGKLEIVRNPHGVNGDIFVNPEDIDYPYDRQIGVQAY